MKKHSCYLLIQALTKTLKCILVFCLPRNCNMVIRFTETIVSLYLVYLDNCILELLPRSSFTEVVHVHIHIHVFHVLSSSWMLRPIWNYLQSMQKLDKVAPIKLLNKLGDLKYEWHNFIALSVSVTEKVISIHTNILISI